MKDAHGWERVQQTLQEAGAEVVHRMRSLEAELRSVSADRGAEGLVPLMADAFAVYAALLMTMIEAGARGNYGVVLTLKSYLEPLVEQYQLGRRQRFA